MAPIKGLDKAERIKLSLKCINELGLTFSDLLLHDELLGVDQDLSLPEIDTDIEDVKLSVDLDDIK